YNGAAIGGVSFAPGKVGQAFVLDGSTGYVSIPNAAPFVPSTFTLLALVKPTAASPNAGIVVKDGSYALRLNAAGTGVALQVFVNGTWQTSAFAALTIGQWNYVTG